MRRKLKSACSECRYLNDGRCEKYEFHNIPAQEWVIVNAEGVFPMWHVQRDHYRKYGCPKLDSVAAAAMELKDWEDEPDENGKVWRYQDAMAGERGTWFTANFNREPADYSEEELEEYPELRVVEAVGGDGTDPEEDSSPQSPMDSDYEEYDESDDDIDPSEIIRSVVGEDALVELIDRNIQDARRLGTKSESVVSPDVKPSLLRLSNTIPDTLPVARPNGGIVVNAYREGKNRIYNDVEWDLALMKAGELVRDERDQGYELFQTGERDFAVMTAAQAVREVFKAISEEEYDQKLELVKDYIGRQEMATCKNIGEPESDPCEAEWTVHPGFSTFDFIPPRPIESFLFLPGKLPEHQQKCQWSRWPRSVSALIVYDPPAEERGTPLPDPCVNPAELRHMDAIVKDSRSALSWEFDPAEILDRFPDWKDVWTETQDEDGGRIWNHPRPESWDPMDWSLFRRSISVTSCHAVKWNAC